MVSSKWDTATGEVLIRCDAQTAHELVKLLNRVDPCRELVALAAAVGHTTAYPAYRGEEGKPHA